ncbi:hypothetical protein SLEP1_g12869 [Rubroshorea leprosula]|uniref:Glycosyl hydrolase family 32 C-terminal domain-containing protein n=1 Tax=Rubroshorea leprosula TaxID=152421 RepID=A0AAV5IJP2_9ROSI|nr:hypothetical protein SLEP1_g12869 [Rubroshorea leprosula]
MEGLMQAPHVATLLSDAVGRRLTRLLLAAVFSPAHELLLNSYLHHDKAICTLYSFDLGSTTREFTCFPSTPGKPVILYTGIDKENRQTQNLAWPKNLSEPFLRERVKSPQNPLVSPVDGILPDYSRDPLTAWKGNYSVKTDHFSADTDFKGDASDLRSSLDIDKYVVLMCSDQSRSSLREGLDTTTYGAFMDGEPSHEKISLRTLVDHSIIESFDGEGRSCITARVYPKFSIGSEEELYAFNNGTLDVTISKLNA